MGADAYLANASAMWAATAGDSYQDQMCFRADLARMTRIILRAPVSADAVARLVDDVPAGRSVVVEDVFGDGGLVPIDPPLDVLRMPVMVRPPADVPAVADETVRVVRVTDADELAVAEQLIVEGFPVSALLPWRRGEALPPHLLRVPGWSAWLAYRRGVPAAAGYTYDDGRSVGLYWLVTSPGHRSTGLARLLLTRAVAAHPGRPFTLTATDAGLPLYESMGFHTVATTTWYRRNTH